MSENPIPEAVDAAGEAQALPGENPADLLRAKREEKGLSLDEAALVLKLQRRQVVAMEAGDFPSLGSAPHVRGFVRNYARYLDLDPERVLGLIEGQAPLVHHELHGPGNTGVAMPTPGGRKPLAWALAASPLVLVALGLGVLYALGVNFERWRSGPSEPTAEQRAAVPAPAVPTPVRPVVAVPTPLPPVAAPVAAAPAPLSPVAAPVVAVPVPAASVSPVPAAVANSAATVAANTHRMVLNFLQDSWVEIKQGDGRTLISQKVPGGSTRVVEGKPPFSVIIGNAHSVQLQYDDRGVDLTPHTKVDVARLTLN